MLLTDLEILTMVPGSSPTRGAIRIDGERLAEIGALEPKPNEEVRSCSGWTALPGFVQGHVHLCQTLFRNLAEDLPLLDWLHERVWPLEAAHDEASLRASARLALFEMVSGGCTTFQSMETVHGTEFAFDEVAQSGLRAVVGNTLMDGSDVPTGLKQTTVEALATAAALHDDWHGHKGRIFHALCPRFILSCTRELMGELGRLRAEEGRRVHTHAAEHPDEVLAIKTACGKRNLLALAELDLLGPETSLAHCVHLDDEEQAALSASGAAVLHCPSTNLKLGSGIAPVRRYLDAGVPVAIGADGAPANNRLDVLTELRQAALLQQWHSGPGTLSAFDALSLATREGARALGFGEVCGTLEPGKAADLVLMDLNDPRLGPGGDPYTKIVYAADRSHIRDVMVAGRFLDRGLDAEGVAHDAGLALKGVLSRSGL